MNFLFLLTEDATGKEMEGRGGGAGGGGGGWRDKVLD